MGRGGASIGTRETRRLHAKADIHDQLVDGASAGAGGFVRLRLGPRPPRRPLQRRRPAGREFDSRRLHHTFGFERSLQPVREIRLGACAPCIHNGLRRFIGTRKRDGGRADWGRNRGSGLGFSVLA